MVRLNVDVQTDTGIVCPSLVCSHDTLCHKLQGNKAAWLHVYVYIMQLICRA